MKIDIKKIYPLLFVILIACNDETDIIEPTPVISNYDKTGILGGNVTIEGNNFTLNEIAVFFDESKAQITVFSEDKLEVIVPRNLKRYNPVLKVINLQTNKDLLTANFTLKKPTISSYNTDEITFDESLIIYGSNFDIDKNFIEVYVNEKKAKLIYSTNSQIEIQIPYEIYESSLQIKVIAQLQEALSNASLNLKKPVIESVENTTAWLRGQLKIKGKNFNPNNEFGDIYINNVKSHFTASNSEINITVPYGPYSDFYITNITYKTANLESSFDTNLEIGNVGIMVDIIKNIHPIEIFVSNDKAYTFTSAKKNSSDEYPTVEFYEFSGVTEKWTKIEGFEFQGYVNNTAFDNKNTIYFYLGFEINKNKLIKIDLIDFSTNEIELPFHESLSSSKIFSFQKDLYVLFGQEYINGQSIKSDKKYKYKSDENKWETLDNSMFTDNAWKTESFLDKMIHKNELYLSIGYKNYKLEDDLSLTPFTNFSILMFSYNDVIIGRQANRSNTDIYVHNIFDVYNTILLSWDEGGFFFVLNNEIYYHDFAYDYEGNGGLSTYKLKKELLNDIL